MNTLYLMFVIGLAVALAVGNALADEGSDGKKPNPQSPLDFTVKDMGGKDVPLSRYQGKVVMIVNVASKCGLTPQYAQLVALDKKYREQGLAILGFPANNFKGQEPGTNEEIKSFCRVNYGVEFDLFAKISVAGKDQAPLYQWLTSRKSNGKFGGDIEWNFAKFLVNREGKVIARFHPKVKPDAPEVLEAIEKALAERPVEGTKEKTQSQ